MRMLLYSQTSEAWVEYDDYSYLLLVKSFKSPTLRFGSLVTGLCVFCDWEGDLVSFLYKGNFSKKDFDLSRYFQFENSTKNLSFQTAITTLHSRQGDREQFGWWRLCSRSARKPRSRFHACPRTRSKQQNANENTTFYLKPLDLEHQKTMSMWISSSPHHLVLKCLKPSNNPQHSAQGGPEIPRYDSGS